MEYIEFKRHLGKGGLGIKEFASLLDVSPTAVTNHASKGVVPRSYAALAILIGDAADRGSDFRTALSRFGIHILKSPAGNVSHLDEFKRKKKGRRV